MLKRYCDMHVCTSHSTGRDSVADVVERAKILGLDTIVILDRINSVDDFEKLKADIADLKQPDVKVLAGVEVFVKNANDLRKAVDRFRDRADIVAVAGGELEVNRAAVENPKVDLLVHPELGRKDSGLDHVMAKLAADNHVAIELNFRSYLYSYKKVRAHVLSHMMNNVMLCQRYGAQLIATSGAESVWDMRAGRELASLSYIAGLDRERAVKSVSDAPIMMIERVMGIKRSP